MPKKGFTLIEILLVVAAIAILSGIVVLAINPGKQLADTRDAQRHSDVKTILEAVYQYSIDHDGTLPSTLPTESTEICKPQAITQPVAFSPDLLMASVNTSNGQSTLNVRTSCLPGETLASNGDVQPVKSSLCSQAETWGIMELSDGKKLSGSGYGCNVENQLNNEGFGHRVCKADIAEEEVPEVVVVPEEEVTLLDESSESSSGCIDLSFLMEDETYLVNLPEDPKNKSETGIGYFISRSDNDRITISAPNAEQETDLNVTR